jgi:hypothetical protein
MITVTPITNPDDKFCNTCAAHRRPDFECLQFVEVRYSSGGNNATRVNLCSECAAELRGALAPSAPTIADLRNELHALQMQEARDGIYTAPHIKIRIREIEGILSRAYKA